MSQLTDNRDYEWFCGFLATESAIVIDATKDYLVDMRMTPIMREFGLAGFQELVARLKGAGSARLRQCVIEAMTTNETSFFRDVHPFDVLRESVLPELVAARKGRGLNVWCAAASTGQEPYTIAMVMQDACPEVAAASRILCTDINETVLARTAKGSYSQLEVNRGLPAPLLLRHFERRGVEWQAKEALRRMIVTRVMNLAVPWTGLPVMDVVFIRNVMIYFEVETKKAIIGRIHASMAPDGVLFLGGAETLHNVDPRFSRVTIGRTSVYRRTS